MNLNLPDRYRSTPDLSFSKEVLAYFEDRYAFLQIVSTNDRPYSPDPELITAPSEWIIHDYGNAMSSSPGALLFGQKNIRSHRRYKQALSHILSEKDGDEGGDSGVGTNTGTIYHQATITAQMMVHLAKEHGWSGINIIDGNLRMKFAAWLAALEENLHCVGYKPTKRDYDRMARIQSSEAEDQIRMRSIPRSKNSI